MIDRILASLRALVESFTERQPMSFVWRYSVVEVTETAFSGRALSALCPFADMPNIPLMPGIAGAGVKPAVGSIAGVAFLDGDPSKPFVVCWDQTVPQSITIDATGVIHMAPTVSGTVQIGDDSAPAAQAVALAPAVTSFANASTTHATAEIADATATAAAFNALALFPAIAAVPPLAALLTAAGTAATAEATAAGAFSSAVGALIGNWPTGFTATKTTTK